MRVMLERFQGRAGLRPRTVLPFILIVLVACSTSTEQPSTTATGDAGALFESDFDPSAGTFVFQRVLATPPDLQSIPIDLLGAELEVHPDEQTVALDVAIRNVSDRVLHPSVSIALHQFNPLDVVPLNADIIDSTFTSGEPEPRLAYLYDFSELLGNDGVLTPGETSATKHWVFSVPDLVAFSFAADALVGLVEPRSVVAGTAWLDENHNGEFEPDEQPARAGVVHLAGPGGASLFGRVAENGRYRIPVREAGLYAARFTIPLHNLPLCFSTPHPLEILLPPGPDGWPVSFEEADFGLWPWPCGGDTTVTECRVVMTDLSPQRIEQHPYRLLDLELEGDWLTLRVGYSGCQPEHPFTLFMSRSFMESHPVRTWALLQHDDLGELCEAYWVRTLRCNLQPLREAHVDAYGHPGIVIIQYRDFEGHVVESLEFGP